MRERSRLRTSQARARASVCQPKCAAGASLKREFLATGPRTDEQRHRCVAFSVRPFRHLAERDFVPDSSSVRPDRAGAFTPQKQASSSTSAVPRMPPVKTSWVLWALSVPSERWLSAGMICVNVYAAALAILANTERWRMLPAPPKDGYSHVPMRAQIVLRLPHTMQPDGARASRAGPAASPRQHQHLDGRHEGPHGSHAARQRRHAGCAEARSWQLCHRRRAHDGNERARRQPQRHRPRRQRLDHAARRGAAGPHGMGAAAAAHRRRSRPQEPDARDTPAGALPPLCCRCDAHAETLCL